MLVTEKSSNSNFTRGDKASVSVRLRSNKTKTDNPGVKKRNRHSGDFSFFKHSNNKERFVQVVFTKDIEGGVIAEVIFVLTLSSKEINQITVLNFPSRLKSLGQ